MTPSQPTTQSADDAMGSEVAIAPDNSKRSKAENTTIQNDNQSAQTIQTESIKNPSTLPKVLHVMAVSVPHLNGYTMRSKYIIEAQDGHVNASIISSPFYMGNEASFNNEEIDGVQYYRVPHPADRKAVENSQLAHFTFGDRFAAGAYRLRKWVRKTLPKARLFCFAVVRKLWNVLAPLSLTVGRCILGPIVRLLLLPFDRKGETIERSVPRGNLLLRWIRSKLSVVWHALDTASSKLISLVAHLLQGFEDKLLLKRFEREIMRVARESGAEIIHAHSPYRCGLPAAAAGKKLGIPVLYEVRGMWEESGVAAGRFKEGDTKHTYWKKKETSAMLAADTVVCICDQLRQEVISRGVPANQVVVVPNAVDPEIFGHDQVCTTMDPQELAKIKTKLRGTTLGYVGSIRKLEGVDELVRGAGEAFKAGEDVSLLIVGDGPGFEELKELAVEYGLEDRAVFTGRVPHDEVQTYYQLIDIFVVSRPSFKVTRQVTPLKPLEAMAMRKAIIVSNLPALCELVNHGDTGLVYEPGNPKDLADKCTQLIKNPAELKEMGIRAHDWIVTSRTWDKALTSLFPAYERLRKEFKSKN